MLVFHSCFFFKNSKLILAQLKFLKKSFKLIKTSLHSEGCSLDGKGLITALFTVLFEAYKTHAAQFPSCTTQDTKITRYYIFDTLVSFAKHFNAELSVLVFDGLLAWFLSAQAAINVHDRTQFVDVISLIASADAGKQLVVSNTLLAPVAAQISQFASWAGDPKALWHFLGAKTEQSVLYNNLATVSSCFRRLVFPVWSSQDLMLNVVRPTLEVTLSLVESCHRILSPVLRRASSMCDDNAVLTEVEEVYAPRNAGKKDPRRSALFNLLESLYVVLGKILESGGVFPAVPGLLDIFTGRVIGTLPFSANYDAVNMFLFRVMGPLTKDCGTNVAAAASLQAQKVAVATYAKLSWDALLRDWAPLVKDAELIRLAGGEAEPAGTGRFAGPSSYEEEGDGEDVEIKKDASLRSFSRKFFEWIHNEIMKQNGEVMVRGDIEMVRFIAALAVQSMSFPDSRIATMSHMLLLKLFSFFPTKQQTQPQPQPQPQQSQSTGVPVLADEQYVWTALDILEGIVSNFLKRQTSTWQPQSNFVEVMLTLLLFTAPVQSSVVQKMSAVVQLFDAAKYAKCMKTILSPKCLKKVQLSQTKEVIQSVNACSLVCVCAYIKLLILFCCFFALFAADNFKQQREIF